MIYSYKKQYTICLIDTYTHLTIKLYIILKKKLYYKVPLKGKEVSKEVSL